MNRNNTKTLNVKLGKKEMERDINIVLPNGKTIQVQYRNYEGNLYNGHGASIDFIFPSKVVAHNWQGTEMKPAPTVNKKEVHLVDQIACIL